jgi:hypothetical protein
MTKLLEFLACLPLLFLCAVLVAGIVRAHRAAHRAAARLGGTVVAFTWDGKAAIRCPDTPRQRWLRDYCEHKTGLKITIVGDGE